MKKGFDSTIAVELNVGVSSLSPGCRQQTILDGSTSVQKLEQALVSQEAGDGE